MANVNEVRVPIIPEQPKAIGNQQLFVYAKKSVVTNEAIGENSIDLELTQYTQVTCTDEIDGNISITIPVTSQGFIAEVDFKTASDWSGTFTLTNDGSKNLVLMKNGIVTDSYTPPADCEVNMLFRDNGIDILCVIVEIR